jgi:signal transduction histidine kinase
MTLRPTLRNPTDDSDILWRDLNYDIGWETAAVGVIRCRSVLNRRRDLFDAVEGLSLRAVLCDGRGKNAWDLLQGGHLVRHVEVRLPKTFGPERLYLTARLLPNGGAVGTFCAVDPKFDDLFQSHVALLSHTTEARAREEELHREADLMLMGLRLLLGQSTAREKLEALSELMIDAITGAEHLILQVGRDGAPRPLATDAAPIAGGKVLAELFQSQLSPVTLHRDDGAHTETLRALLRIESGDVALIFLPVASESIAMICASQRARGFLPEDIGLASRFALILKQALVLKDEQDKLVQSGKLSALGQMSASLAHELRQPLNTISVAAQNLEKMAENGPMPQDVITAKVNRILQQVDRASQIMDRVRRFSRRSSGVLAEVDLVQLADGVGLLMEHNLMQSRVRLEITVERGLKARCDAIQIEQVLANLVRNAIDALTGIGAACKTEKGIISLRGRRTEHGVVLRVEDNGPGFPADVSSRPLETFFTTKGADTGTGLGLSICHMIAREHAGKLELGNYPGGAYVELHLPERTSAEAS